MPKGKLRFCLATPERRFSAVWSITCNHKSGDIIVTTNSLGSVHKVAIHPPRPTKGQPNWRAHFKRSSNPSDTQTLFDQTPEIWTPYQPLEGLRCGCAIYVPHSQWRNSLHTLKQPTGLVVLAPPKIGEQATIAVWVSTPIIQDEWPGKNKGTSLIWSDVLPDKSAVYVVRIDEPAQNFELPKLILRGKLKQVLAKLNRDNALCVFEKDSRGVGIFRDVVSATLLPKVPSVFAERFSPSVQPAVRWYVWAVLVAKGRIRLNWSASSRQLVEFARRRLGLG